MSLATRFSQAGLLSFCVVLCACATAPEPGSRSAELVDVDAELLIRFDDAALFCDRRLLRVPMLTSDASNLGDAALVAYARTVRRFEGTPIGVGPHAGESVSFDGSSATNACIFSTSTELGQDYSEQLEDGFCRADFNHCLGRELEAHAVALPNGADETRLKASLLRLARERLQAASLEYVASLAFYERACVSEPSVPLPGYEYACRTRLLPSGGIGYLPTAHTRLLESVERVVALAQLESELRVDLGDRQVRETPAADPTEPVLGFFGPTGSRTAGVAALYGPPDGVAFERRWNERRLVPVAIPALSQTDESAARALNLMREQAVVTLFGRPRAAGPVVLGSGSEVSRELIFNLLDHRLAAARYAPPYDETRPADPAADLGTMLRSRRPLTYAEARDFGTRPFPAHRSILRTEYRVSEQDIGRALVLAADAYETSFGRFVFAPQLQLGEGGYLLSLVEATPAPRPTEMLTAAFVDEPDLASADALAPMLAPMPRRAEGATGDYYAWDLRRADGTQSEPVGEAVEASLGAAGALHLLRVHLLRLGALDTGFVDTATTSQAVALIEAAIGAEWTEYDATRDPLCACLGGGPGDPIPNPFPPVGGVEPIFPPPTFCPSRDDQALYGPCTNCFCDLQPVAGGGVDWDLYQPLDGRTEGYPVAVYDVDSVRCLVQERRPGTMDDCTLAPTALSLRSNATTRFGRWRRTYRLPEPTDEASHAFVLWVDSEGAYRLVDVVPLKLAAGVHPLGGVFSGRAAGAWRRDPWRPARPSISSRGTARDLVPPLESELISDSDRYEDSFATYLADAALAVQRAQVQLVESRDDALVSRANDVSDAARLEEAALVEAASLAEYCGGRPGCGVERAPSMTLLELGVVGPPPPPPDLGPYADCEEVRERLFTDFHEQVSRGFAGDNEARGYINAHLTRTLGCSMHRYLSELAELRVSGLPVPVVDALATGDDPEFSAYSGLLREYLLQIFQTLAAVRSADRRLGAQRFAALVLIDAAANLISYEGNDRLERDLCLWGAGLSIANSAITIVASAYSGVMGSIGGGANWERNLARDIGKSTSGSASIVNQANYLMATDECTSEDAAETRASQSAMQVVESLATLVALAQSTSDSARSTFYLLGSIDGLAQAAQIAGQRRDAARMLADSDGLADLPEWQSLRGFSQRRASASLARAQHTLFVARRAIELRFGVDLSTMTDPEPLTPPPSTWADSLFDVGGAVASVPESDAEVTVAAEELSLYLERLQGFVDGYPIARRFRDAGDVQILDLGALVEASPDAPIIEQLVFTCAEHPVPLLAGRLPGVDLADAPEPCAGLGAVVRAELHFRIPAELDAYLADRLAAGSFNYRHELLAPNFVGTGVLDCERALDPAECYSDGNVPYALRHEGPFVIENFDHRLQSFAMEPGVILEGRALVAERALTTPLGGHDRSLVSPFYRGELRGRPLSGLYSLTVEGRPEIRWAHIERLQLLIGYRYWTRQE